MYQISCKNESIKDTYVGSTNNIQQRRWSHKSNCYNERRPHYNFHIYKFIRENGGWKNWIVTVLEEFECDTKMDKIIKERSLIDN